MVHTQPAAGSAFFVCTLVALLVEVGALIRTGELKHTRYVLNGPLTNFPSIAIGDAGKVNQVVSEANK